MRSSAAARLLVALSLAAAGCSAGGDDGADGDLGGADGGFPEDEIGYGGGDGTGAGADDGDGPDDDIPNEEDEIDTEAGEGEDMEPDDLIDLEYESGVPDADDPYLEPAAAFAPAAPPLTPGCTATATLGGATAWFFFTRPDAPCHGDGDVDRHAIRELIRLIESVPEGGRIDGHIFSISVDRVARALLTAQRNGVTVTISTDGKVGGSNDVSRTVYLDFLRNKVYCRGDNGNRACIGTAPKAISHSKLFTFSTATTPDGRQLDDVVWFGSANQTPHSGMKLFNNTVTIYGASGLYDDLTKYLDDLHAQKRAADYYKPASGRGRILRNPANVYVSPEAETDLINHRLDDASPDGDCEVRVMQASLRDSRLALASRLVKMKEGGCDVKVVASRVEPEALRRLKRAGVSVRRNKVHDKVFLVRARFGSSRKYRVYTGSHNLGFAANRQFDEIFVKLAPESGDDRPVYEAYKTHFHDAYDDGDPL